jgi:hypothetical protein
LWLHAAQCTTSGQSSVEILPVLVASVGAARASSLLVSNPREGFEAIVVQLFWAENGFDQSFDRESTGFLRLRARRIFVGGFFATSCGRV